MSSVKAAGSNVARGPGADAGTGTAPGDGSPFPTLFGDLIGGDGQAPDAKQLLKPGWKPGAKPSRKTGGTRVALADPPGGIPAQDQEVVRPLPLPLPVALALAGEPAAEPSQPSNSAADEEEVPSIGVQPSPHGGSIGALAPMELAGESTHLSPASHDANHAAVQATLDADVTWEAPVAAPPAAAQLAPEAADEPPARRIPPGTGALAEDAPPDWTTLLDAAPVAAPIVPSPAANSETAPVYWAPQGDGFHPDAARLESGPVNRRHPGAAAARQTALPGPPAHDAAVPPSLMEPAETPNLPFAAQPIPMIASGEPAVADGAAPQAKAEVPANSLAHAARTSPGWMEPAETPNLAFAARLVPLTASGAPAVGDPAAVAADSFGKPALPAAASSEGTATDHQQDNGPAGGQERKDTAAQRFRKTDPPPPAAGEAPLTVGRAAAPMPVTPEPQADLSSVQAASSSGSNPLRPRETAPPPAAPELPRAPAPAREIRLEVGGGDRRVEVRLVERGGELHVAVRTPDAHLAETLREDLPALSSRLTESGFRTETWRPGASGGAEWHRPAELFAGGSPADSSGQPRQNGRQQQPGDQPPARPKVPEEQLQSKEKGKDFEWFISTLR